MAFCSATQPAERIAHDIGAGESQVLDQGGDIVRHQPDAQGSIDVGRPPVALQVDGDDLPAVGERGKVGPEHLERAEAAMQQDERSARSSGLVIELDAVHVGVVAHALRPAAPCALRVAPDRCLRAEGSCSQRQDGKTRGDAVHCHVSSEWF